jgi:7-cyano-7-deazaguanine reductase
MEFQTDKIASTHLGQKSQGSTIYDPSLLVVVPREENRKQYNLLNDNLPFVGWDIWHSYEFSVLTENGVPVTKVLKLKYPCDNKYLIESKSLKLYLNSFNMTRLGKNVEEALNIAKQRIEKDLSEKLQTDVEIEFLKPSTKRNEIFSEFKNIMELVDEQSLNFSQYKESPEVLKTTKTQTAQSYHLMCDSLRSNCRVTHQPDFGDVFIYYKSKKHIEESSLFEYLVSFRSEYHFHEECCEMIYKRLKDLLDRADELMVCALYTRRGGIDITPVRWSENCHIPDIDNLLDLTIFARHGIKQ